MPRMIKTALVGHLFYVQVITKERLAKKEYHPFFNHPLFLYFQMRLYTLKRFYPP
jgi:hypothetical protein